jgi:hypothetical protein
MKETMEIQDIIQKTENKMLKKWEVMMAESINSLDTNQIM